MLAVEPIPFRNLATHSEATLLMRSKDIIRDVKLSYLDRRPKRSMVYVTQHALRIIGICCIDRSFVLVLSQ